MALIHGVVTAGMVFRDPLWSSGKQQEREQKAGGCTGFVFEVFLPDWSADVASGWAPHGGSRWSVTQQGRQLSDSPLLLAYLSFTSLYVPVSCNQTQHLWRKHRRGVLSLLAWPERGK